MKISLLPFGSAGDVLPFVGLGRKLQDRGHDVTLITASLFQKVVCAAGLPFVPIGDDAEFEILIRDPRIWKMLVGTKAVLEYAAQGAEHMAAALEVNSAEHGRPDLMMGPVTAFGGRLMREKWRVPFITVHLQPAVVLSAIDTPVILPAIDGLIRRLPVRLKKWMFRHGPNPIDVFAGGRLRRLCRQQGVTVPKRFFPDWWDSPDGSLFLFPKWFAPPQEDWPQPHFQWTFPLEDLSLDQPLSKSLDSFLTQHSGSAPIVCTAGSANVQAERFFSVAAAALKKIGRAGVLVSRDLSQLPPDLPENIFVVDYAPFGPLLKRCAALAHHGGVGTMSQAIAAGLPQLIMPMAHDQPDNARRVVRLGVGTFLDPGRWTPDNVSDALTLILDDPSMAQSCRAVQAKLLEDRDPSRLDACLDWVESRSNATC